MIIPLSQTIDTNRNEDMQTPLQSCLTINMMIISKTVTEENSVSSCKHLDARQTFFSSAEKSQTSRACWSSSKSCLSASWLSVFCLLSLTFDQQQQHACYTFSIRRRRRRRVYSPNLHTKLKPIKNHVMDGYQKGHMAIQADGLKKKQIIIT